MEAIAVPKPERAIRTIEYSLHECIHRIIMAPLLSSVSVANNSVGQFGVWLLECPCVRSVRVVCHSRLMTIERTVPWVLCHACFCFPPITLYWLAIVHFHSNWFTLWHAHHWAAVSSLCLCAPSGSVQQPHYYALSYVPGHASVRAQVSALIRCVAIIKVPLKQQHCDLHAVVVCSVSRVPWSDWINVHSLSVMHVCVKSIFTSLPVATRTVWKVLLELANICTHIHIDLDRYNETLLWCHVRWLTDPRH